MKHHIIPTFRLTFSNTHSISFCSQWNWAKTLWRRFAYLPNVIIMGMQILCARSSQVPIEIQSEQPFETCIRITAHNVHVDIRIAGRRSFTFSCYRWTCGWHHKTILDRVSDAIFMARNWCGHEVERDDVKHEHCRLWCNFYRMAVGHYTTHRRIADIQKEYTNNWCAPIIRWTTITINSRAWLSTSIR